MCIPPVTREQLTTQAVAEREAAGQRPRRDRRPPDPGRARVLRRSLWHDRVVVTVSVRPARSGR
ncbi:hypothetical protein FB554_0294 [Barrientosiimonas humi]|uniref:Uncharacterized protein n=1 Tax=Barrientosiimonas humi TaxID=999931 RepID=A0A542X8L5_9MICO|nr:hypothetical protein FB554_0294 [Barrientosiimonas humi]CAG7572165.1 hypothetical protein BH39T_PBIAJDOK_00776 [Barrientosiimonas humi]